MAPASAGSDPLLALERRWQEIEDEYGRVCLEHDLADFHKLPTAPALQAALEAVQERWDETLALIAETPATTLAGLAVKFRMSRRDIVEGPSNYAAEMIESAIADAERMAAPVG